jgi:uncharacterized protein
VVLRFRSSHLNVTRALANFGIGPLVCEPVVAEAMHLLANLPRAQDALLGLLENSALSIGLRVQEHISAVRKLHKKHHDMPMSLADACVVRMSELYEHHAVLTLDSHFTVYRKHGRIPLTLIYPEEI